MKPGLKIPPILLEGDELTPTGARGTGRKFAISDQAVPATPPVEQLPKGYGTGKLLLLARDPHGLYANWDPSDEQNQALNQLVPGPEIKIRVYRASTPEQPAQEAPMPRESRHCFVAVKEAGHRYTAEVGFQDADGQWRSLAKSEAVATPPDKVAPPGNPLFVTLALDRPAATPATSPPPPPPPNPSPAQASSLKPLPRSNPAPASPKPLMPPHDLASLTHTNGVAWIAVQPAAPARRDAGGPARTKEQQHILCEGGVWGGPTGIQMHPSPERVVGWLAEPVISSLEAAGLELPAEAPGGITSPVAGEQRLRGFWFKVNAELIIYGATEPGARVTAEGQPVELRPDGTFSFRVALPDGFHALALAADSGEGDRRAIKLVFVRSTEPGS